MLTIPKEKVFERWDSLSDELREVLLSEETADYIKRACQTNGVPENKINVVKTIVGDVIMGFIKAGDLPEEIVNDLKITPGAAAEIYKEIDAFVFAPIRSEVQRVYKPMTPTRPIGDSLGTPLPQEKLKPAFVPNEATPFILHKEEQVKATGESLTTQPGLKRPSFYKPAFSQYASTKTTQPEAARLELGIEEAKRTRPEKIKVGDEEARIVHYSEMRTPLDPFSKIPAPRAEIEKKKEIHPDNIINLKDLPL